VAAFFSANACFLLVLMAAPSLPRWAAVGALFCGRATALGFNQSLWVYTAEFFPTAVRATGLGVTTCFARFGGMATAGLTALYATSRAYALLACAAMAALSAAIALQLPAAPSGGGLLDRT
jgi:hypothetical protein